MKDKFQIITYSDYCKKVLLTEETMEELMVRLQAAFPDPQEFNAHKAILDKFPTPDGKRVIAGLLIRTRFERKKENITPEQTLALLDEFKKVQMALTGGGKKIDLPVLAKQDRIEHNKDEDSHLFEKLTLIVHQKTAELRDIALKKQLKKAVKIEEPKTNEPEVEDEPTGREKLQFPNADNVYVDDNVEIYLTLSPGIIRQMVNDPGSICTQRDNYFGYRFNKLSTLYIVIPKTPELKLKYRFLQFDLRPNGTLVVVDQGNRESAGTMEAESRNTEESLNRNLRKTLAKFPELTAAVENGVFKVVPIQNNEKSLLEKIQRAVDDTTFKSFDYITKTAYISYGHTLTDNQWGMTDDDQKNSYVNACNDRDLTPYQFEQIKPSNKLTKRYLFIKKRSVIDKIEKGTFTRDAFTPHESLVLGDILKTADPKIKSAVSRGLIDNIKKALTGQQMPKFDISAMYNLVKQDLLSNPAIKDPQFLTNIAKLLSGEKTTTWRGVDPEILKSIYSIAKDIYDTDPDKIHNVINDLIRKDPNVLLQGLLTQPTHFQLEYFKNNKEELLKLPDFNSKLEKQIESNLIFGTEMPQWLKGYWNENKNEYFKNPEFTKTIKYDLASALYGKSAEAGHKFNIETASEESKEIYKKYINEVKSNDQLIRPMVQDTLYNLATSKEDDANHDIDNVDRWDISTDFKNYVKQNEKELKTWIVYKIIQSSPDPKSLKSSLYKLVQNYSSLVFENPEFKNEIENKLIEDIITNPMVTFRWGGERVTHWFKNFYNILNSRPGMEEKLVDVIIDEYGKDRAANGFYTEFGIPYEFYKKHEHKILANKQAHRGLRQKVIEMFIWRDPPGKSDQDSFNQDLSKIEQDFYTNHRNEFTANDISIANSNRR